MSYFLEERPSSPQARAHGTILWTPIYLSKNAGAYFAHLFPPDLIEHLGKKKVPGKGHHESEGIWDYGYSKLFTSTNHADFKPKKVDPRVKPQRPIKSGVFGAGIDHISFR
ncbi:hypothetical protein HDU78_004177 [Chytriomyces hyalinus]|nr:hypothetical protein HDU78_004177 [Chytriomyces hyalinus]